MRLKRIYAALSLIIVVTLACNLPFSTLTTAARKLAATITAQAGMIVGQQPSSTAPAVPVTGGTGNPGQPQASVTSPTNCRTGPSTSYDLVFVVNPGTSYPVVGRYTPGDYWIINDPSGGTCWLWGQLAVVTGDTAGLPEYTAAPAAIVPTSPVVIATATPGPVGVPTLTPGTPTATSMPQATPVPPAAPTNLLESRTCASAFRGATAIWVENVTLTWRDTVNETGYTVYQNGTAISDIPQNSNVYQIQLRYNQGSSSTTADTFALEAYNDGGASSRLTLDVPRCP